jgi:hypothetical protein
MRAARLSAKVLVLRTAKEEKKRKRGKPKRGRGLVYIQLGAKAP